VLIVIANERGEGGCNMVCQRLQTKCLRPRQEELQQPFRLAELPARNEEIRRLASDIFKIKKAEQGDKISFLSGTVGDVFKESANPYLTC